MTINAKVVLKPQILRSLKPILREGRMDLSLVKQWITHWEGWRSRSYRDSRNIPTIGVGFNLTTAVARPAMIALGLDYEQVLAGAIQLTAEQIDELLTGGIQRAIEDARVLVPSFDRIPADQQLVLIDLAFNMGQQTLSEFARTLRFIEQQDWTNAASNLRQSAWFKEVGTNPTQRGGADVAVLGGMLSAFEVLAKTATGQHPLQLVS